MRSVSNFIPKVYLIDISGERWKFKNLKQAANELHNLGYFNYWSSLIGDSFKKYWSWSNFSYHQYEYIVRTEIGDIVTAEDLREAIRKPCKRSYQGSYRWNYNPEKDFRNGPLRSVHDYGNWRGHRHPKTTQERRIARAHERDEDLRYYGIKVRAKRNFRNLPNAWDDISHSDWGQKNWKNYRRTQYKKDNK